MAIITDDYMREMLSKTKNYSIVMLKPGENRNGEGVEKIIWEHGRRNLKLRAEGKLVIVCPVPNGRIVSGICIFNCSVEEVKEIMDGDPGVIARIFEYEVYECRSFPGDSLPG
jgi:hypothetical protein